MSNIPANLAVWDGLMLKGREQYFLFRSILTYQEGEGPSSDRNVVEMIGGGPSLRALVLFIALPETENKNDPG